MTRRMLAILENHDFIAPVATIVEKGTEKSVDVESQREGRRWKFVEATFSTDARFASWSNRHTTNISNKWTNMRAYFKMSEERAPELPS